MPDANATSRMLTLVFTDLADSTALKARHGDSTADSLVTRHQDHVTRLAVECSGRIIDWAGDGCFLTFEISSAGVIFALRLQQAHAEEPDLPGVRIGMHHGEVTEKPGTGGGPPRVGGLAVDLASRICGLARPGQVLMSSAVYNSARQRLGVEAFGQPVLWQTHGTYALKGFDEPLDIGEAALEGLAPLEAPVSGDKAKLIRRAKPGRANSAPARWVVPMVVGAVVLLALAGGVYLVNQLRYAAPAAPAMNVAGSGPIRSLAVLPLDNLSNDPDQDYFADGMTEAITSELSKIKALKIISRTSVMKYKASDQMASEIAADLGVDGLIDGTIQREGGDVRISVTLVRGANDENLWTSTYTSKITSVLALQSEVALAIAEALQAELTGDERRRLANTRSVDPKAHDAYLLGIHFLDQITGEGLRTSIRYFEQATTLDPTFAEAWARLANSYRYLTGFGFESPAEAFEKARAADLRALEIDPDLTLAHIGLARTLWSYDYDWQAAEDRFLRALDLEPNSAYAHNSYALYLAAMGRRLEAVDHAALALELDPEDPWNVRNSQMTFVYTGHEARGREALEHVLETRPDFIPAHVILVGTYAALGDTEKSLAAGERWVELSGRSTAAIVGLAENVGAMGQTERARALLEAAIEQTTEPIPSRMSLVYAVLGDFDRAFEWMERSIESRDFGVYWFRTMPYRTDRLNHPNMIRFRTDDRFHQFVERLHYPPLPPDHPGYAEELAWLERKKAAADANAPIRSLAVLPLENFSNDPDQEYFADGMTEAVTSELSKIKALRIISRTSVMKYKKSDQAASEIAAALKVDGLIAGSVQREGDEVKITVSLIRGANDENLWTHDYRNKITSVLALQSEVALAIVDALKAELTPDELARATRQRSVKPEAYDEYLLGLQARELGTREGIMASVGHFNRATQLDPQFADAWGRLGQAYCLIAGSGALDPGSLFPLARAAGQKALALDGELPSAHNALGICALMYDWEWDVARTHFQTSVDIDPNGVFGNLFLSTYLMWMGRSLEGVPYATKALELGSADPWVVVTGSQLLSTAGRSGEAKAYLERAFAARPDFVPLLIQLSAVYETTGEQERAERMIARAAEIDGGSVSSLLRGALAAAGKGNAPEAQLLLEKALGTSGYIEPGYVYPVYVLLGDLETAFEWIEKGLDARSPGVASLRALPYFPQYLNQPQFIRFRNDPRYHALLDRLKFPLLPEEHPGYAEEQAWLTAKPTRQTTP